MLPRLTPPHVRDPLCRGGLGPDYEAGMLGSEREGWGGDLALSLALGEALGAFSCGHPHDGQRPPRPRRAVDPRMGAVTSMASAPSAPSAPSGGGGGATAAPSGGAAPSSPSASPPAFAGGGGGGGGRGRGRGDHDRDWPPRFGRRGRDVEVLDGGDLDGGEAPDGGDDGETVETEVIDYDSAPAAPSTQIVRVPGETKIVRVPVAVPSAPRVVEVAAPDPGPVVVEEDAWPPRIGRRRWGFGGGAAGGGWRGGAGPWGGGGRAGGGVGPGHVSGSGVAVGSRTTPRAALSAGQGNAYDTGGHGYGSNQAAAQSGRYGAGQSLRQAATNQAAGKGLSKADADAEAAGYRAAGLPVAARDLAADPSLKGVDPALGYVRLGWHGDRVVGDRRLARAIAAWRSDPLTRARLEAGGTVYGFDLGTIMAAAGVPVEVPVDVDPPLVGPGVLGGLARGGGGLGGGGGRRFGRRARAYDGSWPPAYATSPVLYEDDGDDGAPASDPPLFGYSAPRCMSGCGTGA